MSTRKFALFGGIVMLVMGFWSLIPMFSGGVEYLPFLKVTTSYGLFLGIFPMNIFNKVALIIFGLWGISAARASSITAAVKYSRTVCIVMGVLAVCGLFPGLNTLYGYWPLFAGEIVAHGAFAALGAYFGYVVPSRAHIHTAV